ncbi:MAG TPA: hypothetical protein VK669_07575 [Candidatus Limnocylindrales bacterium]|nr:hypothetical protein [Candidatus Limnocylindrales bacterium]
MKSRWSLAKLRFLCKPRLLCAGRFNVQSRAAGRQGSAATFKGRRRQLHQPRLRLVDLAVRRVAIVDLSRGRNAELRPIDAKATREFWKASLDREIASLNYRDVLDV